MARRECELTRFCASASVPATIVEPMCAQVRGGTSVFSGSRKRRLGSCSRSGSRLVVVAGWMFMGVWLHAGVSASVQAPGEYHNQLHSSRVPATVSITADSLGVTPLDT